MNWRVLSFEAYQGFRIVLPQDFYSTKFLHEIKMQSHGIYEQLELMLKTPKEMNLQITDRISIDFEIMKILKDIMENPKKWGV